MIEICFTGSRTGFTYNSFKFSGGEIQVQAGVLPHAMVRLTIVAHLESSDDILELMMAVDAVRRQIGPNRINLICPYLPYARQDRVMQQGEALGVKVMCDIINSLGFNEVTLWDVHSDVALALINNVHNCKQSTLLRCLPIPKDNLVLVAPDAGAIKKTFECARNFGLPMVRADKTRSVVDGSITGTTVYSEHIGKKDFLIVDDICDGGRTFIELAKQLRPYTDGKVLLYVTHGIFSKGFTPFEGLIDKIFVANPFRNVDMANPLVEQLRLVD